MLSGGLDSATTLAIARDAGFECFCLSLDYGQRNRSELAAAARVTKALGAAEHRVLQLSLAAFGGSALTDEGIAVPVDGAQSGISAWSMPSIWTTGTVRPMTRISSSPMGIGICAYALPCAASSSTATG